MSYSEFTLATALRAFALTLDETTDLFHATPEVAVPPRLQDLLDENVPLALAIHTEKARSELIVMPILVELRRMLDRRISLFSGIDFTVDPARGLNGVCDFIVSRSPEQLVLNAPALVLIEAKNDNIKSGLGQCIAAMVAAQEFNQREGNPAALISGVVTTGSIWKFLRLTETVISVDVPEYYLDRLPKILGILQAMTV
jgi:hypothetical protein